MKVATAVFFTLFFSFNTCSAQVISVANEHENVVTIGLDNPLILAVENTPAKLLVVKTDNGEISGENGSYNLRPDKVGKASVIIYKKANGKLKEIGRKAFRAKLIWDPVFKIGSGKKYMSKVELAAQMFVRAQLENSDYDLTFRVDSFRVCIILADTCSYTQKFNIGNTISKEINNDFQKLHKNDTVIFKDIFCMGPGGQRQIEPAVIFISE